MDKTQFLKELDGLTHSARIQRMVELGRASQADASARALIDSLEEGDVYERFLATESCFGSRDGARLLRRVSDPSALVRGSVIPIIPLACDDAQVQAALALQSPKLRRKTITYLVKHKRQAPVDAYLESVAETDPDLNKLLAYGSPALISRFLDSSLKTAGRIQWQRIAKFHPEVITERLLRDLESRADFDQRSLWLAQAVLASLSKRNPALALRLGQALAASLPLSAFDLTPIMFHLPNEIADLVLSVGGSANLDPVVKRLDESRLSELLAKELITTEALPRLKPEKRAELYTLFEAGWRDRDGILDTEIVSALPRDLREKEGRRHLALPVLAARPMVRLGYVAFLPWAEALEAVQPYLRNPDADLRVAAWSGLINAVRFQRQAAAELLTMIRARKNEQDPVRLAILQGLVNLPSSLWKAEHLTDLGQMIREALNAKDLSPLTARSAESLILAILPFHPEWSADWIRTLVQERGHISAPADYASLPEEAIRRIAQALLPVLHAWETRERQHQIVNVAFWLDKRLSAFEGLPDILVRLVKESVTAQVALNALRLLMRHLPAIAAKLIPELVEADPSWGTQHPVYMFLHRKRQDLLTPLLGHTAYKGRFSMGKTRFVLPLRSGFERWTPRQQAMFAETLSHVAGDEVRDTPAVMGTIHQLCGLMYVPPTRLLALASDPRQAVRDTALLVLGQLDAGQGVDTLVAALDDDRARIAIYALRKVLLQMSAARALEMLRAVPLAKVTVAKEVARLIGDLRTDEAFRALLEWHPRDLHRDVRVALLRALWNFLERDETWPILEAASAPDSDPALATAVISTPAESLSLPRQTQLVAILVRLLRHPEPTVRVAVLQRCGNLPVVDVERALLAPLLDAVGSGIRDEAFWAASAAFATYAGRDAEAVVQALSTLLDNRRALAVVDNALALALWRNRSAYIVTTRAVVGLLARDPLLASMRLRLAIHALPWDEVAALAQHMAESGDLHAEALFKGCEELMDVVLGPNRRNVYYENSNGLRKDLDELAQFEAVLSTSTEPALRRLALAALLALAETSRGWLPALRAKLAVYQRDATPLVAAAAQFTFPPELPADEPPQE